MRLCRFDDNRLGLVDGDQVLDVTPALDVLPAVRWPYPPGDPLIRHLDAVRAKVETLRGSAPRHKLSAVKLLAPVANPSKIPAAPVNYKAHEEEAASDPATFHGQQVARIQEVGLFLKANSSLVGASEGVPIALPERRTDHEIELAVVIGREAFRVKRDDAMSYIAGYAIGLDMTLRGKEERSLRKSCDGFTVLGPWFVTADEIPDPGNLEMTLMVGNELRQHANTKDLVIDIPGLIEMATKFYTLVPGDIIMTGTPDGVGPVKPGDEMLCTIEKIGEMRVALYAH
jgi:2,4-didehydro-3-deoxy-L-rhamnonate hydrolase